MTYHPILWHNPKPEMFVHDPVGAVRYVENIDLKKFVDRVPCAILQYRTGLPLGLLTKLCKLSPVSALKYYANLPKNLLKYCANKEPQTALCRTDLPSEILESCILADVRYALEYLKERTPVSVLEKIYMVEPHLVARFCWKSLTGDQKVWLLKEYPYMFKYL